MHPCASQSARQRRRSLSTPEAVWHRSSGVLARSFITIAETQAGTLFARSCGGTECLAIWSPLFRCHSHDGRHPGRDQAPNVCARDVWWHFGRIADSNCSNLPSEVTCFGNKIESGPASSLPSSSFRERQYSCSTANI
jgi:hypothetical protein